jgi:predicted Zn-dependent peptidase
VEIREEMDVKEAYLAIGLIGPDYNNPDQYAVDLLTEILGRGVNPMLNSALRARWNLIQTVTMNYSAHKFGGALMAFFTLDPKDVSIARTEALRFLNQVRDLNFAKEDYLGQDQLYVFDYLRSAKAQVRFSSQKAQETGLLLAGSLARHLLLFEDNGNKEGFLARIDRVNSSDLRKAAAIYLSKGEGVVVTIVPKRKS